jgi:hypothetical protein
MNERHFAHRIRHALDESAECLPNRVTERLARSRALALSRMPETPAPGSGRAAGPVDRQRSPSRRRPSLWLRVAGGALPALTLVLGMYGIAAWHAAQQAHETAEVDVALLTDELPIHAYADHGFGVFIRNSRQ